MKVEETEETRKRLRERAKYEGGGLTETPRPRERRKEEGLRAAREGVEPRAAEMRDGVRAVRMLPEIVVSRTTAAAAEAAGSREEASRTVLALTMVYALTGVELSG